MGKDCQCTGCKYSRGEASGEEYQKWLEDSIKECEEEIKTEKDEDKRAMLQCNIDEGNELLIEYLKSKEQNEK